MDPLPNSRLSEKGLGVDAKGEQLFYKLANLDDRVKNADQVGNPPDPIKPAEQRELQLTKKMYSI